MNYWLLKSEPGTFSIDDLAPSRQMSSWDGVRNYQARNMLRDCMKQGTKPFSTIRAARYRHSPHRAHREKRVPRQDCLRSQTSPL